MASHYHIVGIGNAIMDVIAPVDDEFLADHHMTKGIMSLIDQDRALSLDTAFREAGQVQTIAGGSAANTMVGLAAMGLKAAYIGKVGKDRTGQALSDGFTQAGLDFATRPTETGTASARSMIAVTPDGERTMNTFLGASIEFEKADVQDAMIRAADLLYLEGYLFDADPAKAAFVHAAEVARASGGQVAVTLSDPFCVERHRESFRHLVDHQTDIVFANQDELMTLTSSTDLDEAMDDIARDDLILCVTCGSKGSVICEGRTRHQIPVVWADTLVDTTGAGDQYAAGVLGGRALGMSWADAGFLGSIAAAEVIGHYGARPEMPVHDFALSL
ncbi:adenosine kinase [Algimonas porphyrae]|uniref:Adenosine kinase n=1 Tax=Algimonas porphyrae TaxID=1128113 RepID=A0ABQ5UZ33_9PROT|nr:adenosine kinase [Algimonas porphyrae]GLQ20538.1 adenosine kinase [Algimonas porphyrae]